MPKTNFTRAEAALLREALKLDEVKERLKVPKGKKKRDNQQVRDAKRLATNYIFSQAGIVQNDNEQKFNSSVYQRALEEEKKEPEDRVFGLRPGHTNQEQYIEWFRGLQKMLETWIHNHRDADTPRARFVDVLSPVARARDRRLTGQDLYRRRPQPEGWPRDVPRPDESLNMYAFNSECAKTWKGLDANQRAFWEKLAEEENKERERAKPSDEEDDEHLRRCNAAVHL